MKSAALPCLAALLAACGSTPTLVATGEFAAPSGLAITSGGDRDLLFIANEGHDNLRALQLCRSPLDGGAPDTCPSSQDLQFVPAPIRVFPATIETADRPRRLAGVRLSRPDAKQSPAGVILAVGADSTLRVVDARNLVEVSNHVALADGGFATASKVLVAQLPSPAADVVAENPLDANGMETSAPAGQTATAFVATVPQGAQSDGGLVSAQLLMYQVGLDSSGAAMLPTLTGQCSLDPVVPRKLAVVPGGGDRVYVADGAGDGVVAVTKASIPAPSATLSPCTMTRIVAGGRAARSVSVSPAWWDGTTPHPAGELVIMVLEPLAGARAGSDLDTNGVLIARAADAAIVPAPPSSLFARTDGGVFPDGGLALLSDGGPVVPPPPPLPVMQPISQPVGLLREATFLRALPPDASCAPSDGGVAAAPCTPVYVGVPTTSPTAKFSLLAAATSTDGATYLVDAVNRRFVNSSYFLGTTQTPSILVSPLLSPSTSDPTPPTLTFLSATADHALTGWYTAGVTRGNRWRLVWHASFPGLETRGGFLSTSSTGTLLLTLPGLSLAPWQTDPVLKLGVGDTVTFFSYTAPSGSPQPCSDLVSSETVARFELPVLSMPSSNTLELAPLQPTATARGFNLSACPAGLDVVASVRTAGSSPWLVFEGATARGRAANGQPFVATGTRFDYPLDAASPVQPTDNVAAAFQVGGDAPTVLGSLFSFTLNSGVTPVGIRDTSLPQGFATAVLGYSSPRYPQIIFSSVTGGNAVVQADPTQLGTFTGVVSYK